MQSWLWKEFRQIVLKERIETPQPEPFHSDVEEGEQCSVERGEDEHGKQKPLADSLTGGFVHWAALLSSVASGQEPMPPSAPAKVWKQRKKQKR